MKEDIPDPEYMVSKINNKEKQLLPTISSEYIKQSVKDIRTKFSYLSKMKITDEDSKLEND